MQSRINTVAFNGLEILDVDLQVQIASGLPAFTIVGLPDKAVAESRERVRAALQSLGLSLPAKRITLNLAPADLLKEGSHFDLPVALGLLAGMGVIPQEELADYIALGYLFAIELRIAHGICYGTGKHLLYGGSHALRIGFNVNIIAVCKRGAKALHHGLAGYYDNVAVAYGRGLLGRHDYV